MDANMLLNGVKTALRISTSNFDGEISGLIESAKLDLGVAGVEVPESFDFIVNTAIITYVKMHFGEPDEYERLKRSYDEQKAQLATCTGYTDWG